MSLGVLLSIYMEQDLDALNLDNSKNSMSSGGPFRYRSGRIV